jgi:hypothetical protein
MLVGVSVAVLVLAGAWFAMLGLVFLALSDGEYVPSFLG